MMTLNAAVLVLALTAALHGADAKPQGDAAAQSGWR